MTVGGVEFVIASQSLIGKIGFEYEPNYIDKNDIDFGIYFGASSEFIVHFKTLGITNIRV